MKKNITINLYGRLYAIDEDAYALLEQYLNGMKAYFARREEGAEIADDIEHRVAELLAELAASGVEAVSIEHVQDIISRIGNPQDLDDGETATAAAEPEAEPEPTNLAHRAGRWFGERRLYRDANDKMLGGICAGLCKYFGTDDPLPWRIVMVVLALVSFSVTGILYLVAWCLIPVARTAEERLRMRGQRVTPDTLNEELMRSMSARAQDGPQVAAATPARTFLGTLLAIFLFLVKLLALIIVGCMMVSLVSVAIFFVWGMITQPSEVPFTGEIEDTLFPVLHQNGVLVWLASCALLSGFFCLTIIIYGIIRSFYTGRREHTAGPARVMTCVILAILSGVVAIVLTAVTATRIDRACTAAMHEKHSYDSIYILPPTKAFLDQNGYRLTLLDNCNEDGRFLRQSYDFSDAYSLPYLVFEKDDDDRPMTFQLTSKKPAGEGDYHIEAIVKAREALLSFRLNVGNDIDVNCASEGQLSEMSYERVMRLGVFDRHMTEREWNLKWREQAEGWTLYRSRSFHFDGPTLECSLLGRQISDDATVKVLSLKAVCDAEGTLADTVSMTAPVVTQKPAAEKQKPAAEKKKSVADKKNATADKQKSEAKKKSASATKKKEAAAKDTLSTAKAVKPASEK